MRFFREENAVLRWRNIRFDPGTDFFGPNTVFPERNGNFPQWESRFPEAKGLFLREKGEFPEQNPFSRRKSSGFCRGDPVSNLKSRLFCENWQFFLGNTVSASREGGERSAGVCRAGGITRSGPWASVTGTVFVAMPLLQRVLETGALPRAPSIRPAA
jgi:hypothetical protein